MRILAKGIGFIFNVIKWICEYVFLMGVFIPFMLIVGIMKLIVEYTEEKLGTNL